MKIVYMGTPDFAVPPLKSIYEAGHEVVGVFTQPDRPKGRSNKLVPSDVKVAATELGIEVFQPEKLREAETSYNKTISTKNSEIDNLKSEVQNLSSKNADYESKASNMQETIDTLTSEVETLKKTVENNGITPEQTGEKKVNKSSSGVTVNPDEEQTTNSAADRNNANVVGIDGSSVEDMIANE